MRVMSGEEGAGMLHKSQCCCRGEEVAKWRYAPITESRGQTTGTEKALGSVGLLEQDVVDRTWNNGSLQDTEEGLPSARREGWQRAARSYKASTVGSSEGSHPQVLLDWSEELCVRNPCGSWLARAGSQPPNMLPREAHCTLANVNSSVEMAKVASGKRVYLGIVMLDGCDQEDIGLSTFVEKYSGIDVRNFTKMLGKEEQSRRAKWQQRVHTTKTTKVCDEKYTKNGTRKLSKMWMVLGSTWRCEAVGIAPSWRQTLERQWRVQQVGSRQVRWLCSWNAFRKLP